MAYIFLIITIICILFYCAFFIRSRTWLLLDSFFLGVALYQIGACTLLLEVGWDAQSVLIVATSSACFFISCLACAILRKPIAKGVLRLDSDRSLNKFERPLTIAAMLFLILSNVFLSYILIIKFLDIFLMMESGFLLDIRKKISSGERGFLAPGLIKQIRDIISPAILCYAIIFFRGRGAFILPATLFTLIVFSTTIGGQRLPIVILAGVIFVSLFYYRAKDWRRKYYFFWIGGFFGLISISVLNILLGRSETEVGFIYSLYNTLEGIVWRAVQVVPFENYASVPFLMEMEFSPFSIWLQELSSIIPGIKSSLSSELHANLGGSYEGNSVLGAALASYFNAGYLGVVIYTLYSILLLAFMELLFIKTRSKLLLALRIVLFFQIPIWYTPFLAILNGGLVFAFFVVLLIVYKSAVSLNKPISPAGVK
ncbi:hypothetical protein [Pseudomonas sp.]|uniref:hypothetical protein n=1 Tax=Pseudomonas sp. TaxID=306 RepID=UPI002352FE40|nr:hypothetical protein [Pseudomonas sp.]